jgi:hypothetical protein
MRPSSTIAAIIFIVVAVLQAIRYFNGWVVTVNGMDVPLWVSLAGIVVPAVMAVWLLYEGGDRDDIPDKTGNQTLH